MSTLAEIIILAICTVAGLSLAVQQSAYSKEIRLARHPSRELLKLGGIILATTAGLEFFVVAALAGMDDGQKALHSPDAPEPWFVLTFLLWPPALFTMTALGIRFTLWYIKAIADYRATPRYQVAQPPIRSWFKSKRLQAKTAWERTLHRVTPRPY